MKFRHQGDTLIEVIIAITLFGLIAVGAISVMVQGVYATQRALEITNIRQEIDSQAATLRFLHNAFISSYKSGLLPPSNTPAGQWNAMINYIKASNLNTASEFGTKTLVCPSIPPGSFIMNSRQAKAVTTSLSLIPATLTATTNYDSSGNLISSEGLWIEAIRSAETAGSTLAYAGFIDFHIRSCWISPGKRVPSTLGTIVRLYEPRN